MQPYNYIYTSAGGLTPEINTAFFTLLMNIVKWDYIIHTQGSHFFYGKKGWDYWFKTLVSYTDLCLSITIISNNNNGQKCLLQVYMWHIPWWLAMCIISLKPQNNLVILSASLLLEQQLPNILGQTPNDHILFSALQFYSSCHSSSVAIMLQKLYI